MKPMYMIVLLLTLFLTSCVGVVPKGESIEDCLEQGLCNYLNNDVRTEGSPLAEELKLLIRNDPDSFHFSYGIHPGGDHMSFTYETSEPFDADLMDALLALTVAATTTTESLYAIDEYFYQVMLKEGFVASLYFDDVMELKYLSFSFDDRSSSAIEDDTEEETLSRMARDLDDVKACLDYPGTSMVYWYGNALRGIFLQVDGSIVTVSIYEDEIEDNPIAQYIQEALVDYDIRWWTTEEE